MQEENVRAGSTTMTSHSRAAAGRFEEALLFKTFDNSVRTK